jgi:hypothetical protein
VPSNDRLKFEIFGIGKGEAEGWYAISALVVALIIVTVVAYLAIKGFPVSR